ncbi:hypothetical protein MRB53_039969 [Persea americana]|nr:hypothetical protein MRB53_039969 [Persea americana]
MSWCRSTYGAVFLALFAIRYLRTLVHAVVFFFLVKPVMPTEKPQYTPADVTVLLPTVLKGDITPALRSMAFNDPYEIILVVHENDATTAQALADSLDFKRIRIVSVPRLGKRLQQIAGIKKVQTPICVLCDDDVRWHHTFLSSLLGPSMLPGRRNFNTMTTNVIDGAVSTLSGRSCAIRSEIIQDPKFEKFLIEDDFFGRRIKIGDDKRYTMGLFSQGWKIKLVYSHEAALFTEVAHDSRFLAQCLRWAPVTLAGNLAVVMQQSYWCAVIPGQRTQSIWEL